MSKYTHAESGPSHSVIYTDTLGKRWKFEGGSRAWRNQNPGNMVFGKVSKRNGTIGKAGGFAIFPDYEAGHKGLLDLLKNEYGNYDIPNLMEKYAPKHENNTKAYIRFVRKHTGIKDNKKIKKFSRSEFDNLWKAIEKMEGWGKEGTISEYIPKAQITAIRKNKKGTITNYQIEGYGWVSKKIGIDLTVADKVDAVVATSAQGNKFLRARPNSQTFDNLENKA